MSKNMIILISGKAESGKDTVANYILTAQTKFSSTFSLHFASDVKQIARYSFNWDGNKDAKGRSLLQMIGDGGRAYNPNLWVDRMLATISNTLRYADDTLILIPDTRYKNEVLKTLEYGEKNNVDVVTVRVERPNHENKLTIEQRKNGSEVDLDNWGLWDFKVVNDSSLDALEDSVENMLEVMKLKTKRY